jgi:hypothetical protein
VRWAMMMEMDVSSDSTNRTCTTITCTTEYECVYGRLYIGPHNRASVVQVARRTDSE